jgi:hypothetical protein
LKSAPVDLESGFAAVVASDLILIERSAAEDLLAKRGLDVS